MTRGRIGAVVLAVTIALGAGSFVATHFRMSSALSEMLPSVDDQRLARVAAQLADSELSRTMIFVVAANDGAAARAASMRLEAGLHGDPEVAWVQSGADDSFGAAFYALYHPHRFALMSDQPEQALPPRLDAGGLAKAATALTQQLRLPTAPLVAKLAPADPWLTFSALLARMEAARPAGLALVDGRFMTTDGRHAVVFAATRHGPMDADAQAPLQDRITALVASLAPATVQRSGIHRHALAARSQIQADVQRISIASTIGILALFAIVFRSLGLLGLALLPLAGGVLLALAATLALFGRVHGVTLTFGATLIGVCLDYPLHLFNHHLLAAGGGGGGGGGGSRRRAVWRGLALGALTTAVGYAALGLSALPAIREVAVFATFGVVSALAITRWIVEPWLPSTPSPARAQRALAAGLVAGLATLGRSRLAQLLPVALALLACILWLPSVRFRDEARALMAEDPALAAEDAAVRGYVAAHESGRVVVVTAKTLDAALAANDRLALRLQSAVADGVVDDVRSLHTLLWSPSLQARNLSVLRAHPQLAEHTVRALGEAGFVPTAFRPFERDLTASLAADATPLTWDAVADSAVGPLIRPFRIQAGEEVGVLSFVRGVHDPVALATRVGSADDAVFFDQAAFVAATLARHRRGASALILLGLGLVALVIGVRYRDVRRSLAVLLPALLAAGTTVAVLTAVGEPLLLLHLVALVLVLSMSVDYGVFLAEGSQRGPDEMGATMSSIVLAALSTALAFGLLGMSSNPALRAIGLTTGLGVAMSVVFAPCLHLLIGRSSPRHRADATQEKG